MSLHRSSELPRTFIWETSSLSSRRWWVVSGFVFREIYLRSVWCSSVIYSCAEAVDYPASVLSRAMLSRWSAKWNVCKNVATDLSLRGNLPFLFAAVHLWVMEWGDNVKTCRCLNNNSVCCNSESNYIYIGVSDSCKVYVIVSVISDHVLTECCVDVELCGAHDQ